MICQNCKAEIQSGSLYCNYCGNKIKTEKPKARRGNGSGSVFWWRGSWYAQVTVTSGKKRVTVRRGGYETKPEAEAALPSLRERRLPRKAPQTFADLYAAWEPTHRAGESTMGCYHSAFNHFSAIHNDLLSSITIDDLQDCLDECPNGKRTRQNMKTLCGLIYKYGIPRGYTKINMGDFLIVDAEDTSHKEGFNSYQLSRIWKLAESNDYEASLIIMNCYLGFRPAEFLGVKLEDYDRVNKVITGGIKTEAGKNRFVTISPKILSMVDFNAQWIKPGEYLFGQNGKKISPVQYREMLYRVLDKCGIDNPVIEKGGIQWHTYTPHSCRHTFATLMKRVQGADKDKQSLIGHSSAEMLRYYQDTNISDLRSITDKI